MPRCSERASVSLRMPQPSTKGRGEAYQSWNSDQPTATKRMSLPTTPRGRAAAGVGVGDQLLEIGARLDRLLVFFHDSSPSSENGAGECPPRPCAASARREPGGHHLIQPFSL